MTDSNAAWFDDDDDDKVANLFTDTKVGMHKSKFFLPCQKQLDAWAVILDVADFGDKKPRWETVGSGKTKYHMTFTADQNNEAEKERVALAAAGARYLLKRPQTIKRFGRDFFEAGLDNLASSPLNALRNLQVNNRDDYTALNNHRPGLSYTQEIPYYKDSGKISLESPVNESIHAFSAGNYLTLDTGSIALNRARSEIKDFLKKIKQDVATASRQSKEICCNDNDPQDVSSAMAYMDHLLAHIIQRKKGRE